MSKIVWRPGANVPKPQPPTWEKSCPDCGKRVWDARLLCVACTAKQPKLCRAIVVSLCVDCDDVLARFKRGHMVSLCKSCQLKRSNSERTGGGDYRVRRQPLPFSEPINGVRHDE